MTRNGNNPDMQPGGEASGTMPVNHDLNSGIPENNSEAKEQNTDNHHPSRLSFLGRLACKFVPYGEVYQTLTEVREKVAQLMDQLETQAASIEQNESRLKQLNDENAQLTGDLTHAKKTIAETRTLLDTLCQRLGVSSPNDAIERAGSFSESIAELKQLRASSYATLIKNDYPSLGSKYATINDALTALAHFDAEAAKETPKPRSLAEIVMYPNSEEASMIWEYVNREISSGKPVRSSRLQSIIDASQQLPTLQAQLNEYKSRLADTDAIAGEVLASSWSPAIALLIAAKLVKSINNKIEDETKRLAPDTDLDALSTTVALSLSRPVDTDDAVATGERKILSALSSAIGQAVVTPDEISAAVEGWHNARINTEILDLFTAASATDRESASKLAAVANEAITQKAKADTLLEEYGADTIGALPAAAVAAKYSALKEKYISSTDDDDIAQLVKDGSMETTLKHLIALVADKKKQISAEQKLTLEAREATQAAKAEATKAVDDLRLLNDSVITAVTEALANHNINTTATEPVDAVKELNEALGHVITDTESKVVSLKEAVAERDASLGALNTEIETQKGIIEKFFNSYVAFVKSIFEDMDNAVRTSFIGTNREAPLPRAIDEKILTNDFVGLDEFKESLDENIAKADHSGPDAVANALRATFVECLNIPSATWIDNLGRLFCYSRVPFIAEQFTAKKLDTSRITTAFSLLQALLGRVGITLLYPELFKDSYDADRFDAESIRNIDAYVTDIPAHVDDEDTVIDLYSLGYTLDGKVKAKPIVSRINN